MTEWQNLEGTAEFNRGHRTATAGFSNELGQKLREEASVDAPPLLPPPPPAPELYRVDVLYKGGEWGNVCHSAVSTDLVGDQLFIRLTDDRGAIVNLKAHAGVWIEPA